MDKPAPPRPVPEHALSQKKRPSYSALQQPVFDGLLVPELMTEFRDTIAWRRWWKTAAHVLESLAQVALGIGSVLVIIGAAVENKLLLLIGSCCTPVGLLFLRGGLYAERERKKCEGRYWSLQATIGIGPARRRPRSSRSPSPDPGPGPGRPRSGLGRRGPVDLSCGADDSGASEEVSDTELETLGPAEAPVGDAGPGGPLVGDSADL